MSEKNTEKKVRIGNNVFSLEIVDRTPLEKEMNRSVIEVKARSSKNRAVITGADFKREIQWLLGKEGDNIPIVGKKGKIVLIISKISFDSATIEFDNSSEACGYEPISFHGSRDDCSGIIDNIAEMMFDTADDHFSFLNKRISHLNSDIEKLEEESRHYQEMRIKTGNSNYLDMEKEKKAEIVKKIREKKRMEDLVISFQYYICP